ncbi:hypothetical protein QYE76_003929 [Lolium multiflorum]|uniref:Transposase (putative) gypsy type domain-containing protein n=1 Tax=Lolium multiflorum TaxID=4521 RepID=A0AAD8W0X7_LOLMU|nr:hypothetical protein QYE76_003929 [Lolium multiflorum]
MAMKSPPGDEPPPGCRRSPNPEMGFTAASLKLNRPFFLFFAFPTFAHSVLRSALLHRTSSAAALSFAARRSCAAPSSDWLCGELRSVFFKLAAFCLSTFTASPPAELGRRIPEGVTCRIPDDEIVPDPQDDERVVFLAHFERGFGLPPSSFFLDLLDFYKLQPHHLPGNSVFYLSCYTTFMEAYIGIRPTRTFLCEEQRPRRSHLSLLLIRAARKTNWSYNPKEAHNETNRIIRFMKQDEGHCIRSDDIVRTFISRRYFLAPCTQDEMPRTASPSSKPSGEELAGSASTPSPASLHFRKDLKMGKTRHLAWAGLRQSQPAPALKLGPRASMRVPQGPQLLLLTQARHHLVPVNTSALSAQCRACGPFIIDHRTEEDLSFFPRTKTPAPRTSVEKKMLRRSLHLLLVFEKRQLPRRVLRAGRFQLGWCATAPPSPRTILMPPPSAPCAHLPGLLCRAPPPKTSSLQGEGDGSCASSRRSPEARIWGTFALRQKWNAADITPATAAWARTGPAPDPIGNRSSEEHFTRLRCAVKELDSAWYDATNNLMLTADARKTLFEELLWEHRELVEAHDNGKLPLMLSKSSSPTPNLFRTLWLGGGAHFLSSLIASRAPAEDPRMACSLPARSDSFSRLLGTRSSTWMLTGVREGAETDLDPILTAKRQDRAYRIAEYAKCAPSSLPHGVQDYLDEEEDEAEEEPLTMLVLATLLLKLLLPDPLP